jgi:Flp pilus assembly protein TadG
MRTLVRWLARSQHRLLTRSRSSFTSAEAGAAAVEFALIVPMLLLMVLGLTELGKIVHYRSVLKSAARTGVEAAFSASMNTSAQIAAAQTTMETAADLAITNSGIGGTVTSTATITCECSDGSTVDCASGTCATGSKRYIATVTMSRPYTPLYDLTNLPGGFNLDLAMTLTGNATLWVK